MQFFPSECLTLTGLCSFQYVRFYFVSSGQILAVVPGHNPPFAPSFDELSSGKLTSAGHTHPRALLLARELLKQHESTSDTPGALAFLICAKCFIGTRNKRTVIRRPLVWQFVPGHGGSADSLNPLRLATTSSIQRGAIVSAWEVAEELVGRCLASIATTEEMSMNPLLLNPFRVDVSSVLSLRTEEDRTIAAGALVNFLWEVWSETNSCRTHCVVSGKLECSDYLKAIWNDITALCDAHFVSLDHIQRLRSLSSTVKPTPK